jgi:hypothetical protein
LPAGLRLSTQPGHSEYSHGLICVRMRALRPARLAACLLHPVRCARAESVVLLCLLAAARPARRTRLGCELAVSATGRQSERVGYCEHPLRRGGTWAADSVEHHVVPAPTSRSDRCACARTRACVRAGARVCIHACLRRCAQVHGCKRTRELARVRACVRAWSTHGQFLRRCGVSPLPPPSFASDPHCNVDEPRQRRPPATDTQPPAARTLPNRRRRASARSRQPSGLHRAQVRRCALHSEAVLVRMGRPAGAAEAERRRLCASA